MELFANGALCSLLRLSVVAQNLPAHKFRDHTTIIKRQKEHYNNHQNCHYHKLCAATFDNFVQMPTNPEMYEMLQIAVDRRLSWKIEIVFPITSELLNFAVAKKYL